MACLFHCNAHFLFVFPAILSAALSRATLSFQSVLLHCYIPFSVLICNTALFIINIQTKQLLMPHQLIQLQNAKKNCKSNKKQQNKTSLHTLNKKPNTSKTNHRFTWHLSIICIEVCVLLNENGMHFAINLLSISRRV